MEELLYIALSPYSVDFKQMSRGTLLRYKFGTALISNRFVIVQNAQRLKRVQQFIWLQQERGIVRPTAELLLICGVSLVEKKTAGLERRDQGREELALQIEEDKDKIVLLGA